MITKIGDKISVQQYDSVELLGIKPSSLCELNDGVYEINLYCLTNGVGIVIPCYTFQKRVLQDTVWNKITNYPTVNLPTDTESVIPFVKFKKVVNARLEKSNIFTQMNSPGINPLVMRNFYCWELVLKFTSNEPCCNKQED